MEKYISLQQAAERSAHSVTEWSALCEAALVDCQSHGEDWFVRESDLNDPEIPSLLAHLEARPLSRPRATTQRQLLPAATGLFLVLLLFGGLILAFGNPSLAQFFSAPGAHSQQALVSPDLLQAIGQWFNHVWRDFVRDLAHFL